jgi:hypothetical protein
MIIENISITEIGIQVVINLVEYRDEYGQIKNHEWPRFLNVAKQLSKILLEQSQCDILSGYTLVHVDSQEGNKRGMFKPTVNYQLSFRKI